MKVVPLLSLQIAATWPPEEVVITAVARVRTGHARWPRKPVRLDTDPFLLAGPPVRPHECPDRIRVLRA